VQVLTAEVLKKLVQAFIYPYLAKNKHAFLRFLKTECRFVVGARLGASFDGRSAAACI